MKKHLVLALTIAMTAAVMFGVGRATRVDVHRGVHAQATATPEPSPTPVDQHFKVVHGEIEMFEESLHTLNAAGYTLDSSDWVISNDGKRFVIVVSDSDDSCDDCDEGR